MIYFILAGLFFCVAFSLVLSCLGGMGWRLGLMVGLGIFTGLMIIALLVTLGIQSMLQ